MRFRTAGITVATGLLALWSGIPLCAQGTPVFLQSFRKTRTRVTEESFAVELDPKNPACRIRVRDQSGLYRYQLSCSPQRVGGGDDRILSWQLQLADLHHKIYQNLLMPTPDSGEDPVQIGWLDPGKFAKIPVSTLRVASVDGFYCVIQVQEYHLASQSAPYLDHMLVNVKFTNTNPLSASAGDSH